MPITNEIISGVFSRTLGLDDKESAAIAGLPCRELSLRRDNDVPRDGDAVFVILDGWVCGYKLLGDGERQICSIHIAGDMPDLRRLFLPASDLDYRTLSNCRLVLVSAQLLRDLIRRSATMPRAILRGISIHAAIAEEWVANIGRRRAINRIAHLLCELVYRLDAAQGGARPAYLVPLTQTDLGDATGLSTVHVNRVLQELRSRRLLEFTAGQLCIPDRRALADIAGFDPKYLHLDAG